MDILKRFTDYITGRSLDTSLPRRQSLFYGGRASSGSYVTKDTAMGIAAVYACVRLIAQTIGTLPIHLYKRNQDGSVTRMEGHPLDKLMAREPNPFITSSSLKEAAQNHLCLRGNAYVRLVRNKTGRVQEMYLMQPDKVSIQVDKNQILYFYQTDNGQIILNQSEVLHVKGMSEDGIIGLSPLDVHKNAFGLALTTDEFAGSIFANGARPGGVLEHPGQLSEEAIINLRNSWQKMYQGADKAGSLAVLEEGLTFKPISMTAQDTQFLESRKFQVNEIARIFNVPPHMIGDLDRATFSNIEHQAIEFVQHTIQPWLVRWEEALNKFVVGTDASLFYKFNVEGLLRGDTTSRYNSYSIALNNGWMNIDEVRAKENMNALPEGLGQAHLRPLNMVAIGTEPTREEVQSNEDSAPEPTTAPVDQVLQEVKRAALETIINKERVVMRNLMDRFQEDDKLRAEVCKFFEKHEKFCERTLGMYNSTCDRLQKTEKRYESSTIYNTVKSAVMKFIDDQDFRQKLERHIQ